MMFAVIGSGLSGHVVEILIRPTTTTAATTHTPTQEPHHHHHLFPGVVFWDLHSTSTSSHSFFCCSCQFPLLSMSRCGLAVLQAKRSVGCGGAITQLLSSSQPACFCVADTRLTFISKLFFFGIFEYDFVRFLAFLTLSRADVSWIHSVNRHHKLHFQF